MQTFLPYKNFKKSAIVLDKKRCWKQVVETKQIISILTDTVPQSRTWYNHPAVQMWIGHEELLKSYYNKFLSICVFTHKIRTQLPAYEIDINSTTYSKPWWLGKKKFHCAMRARLIEKDEAFYLPLFPKYKGYNDGKYWWPDMKTKKFKII
jgi:hypothetical protein